MDLANRIYDYYLHNQTNLTDDKLFHFATRMAAWRGEKSAFELLDRLRPMITKPEQSLQETLQAIIDTPQSGRRNAHELRQPFFEKYPLLYGAHAALFRVRHLDAVYGIDARQALYDCIPRETLLELRDSLMNDQEALQVLSTFAVNYCYLLTRVVEHDEAGLDLARFLDAGHSYDLGDKTQVQLLIYLYTHCIIGESNFYTREIPEGNRATYIAMLTELEPIIEANFESINLDNKLEYLVCARICGYETKLFTPVYAEVEQSISPEGTFVIDIHNTNVQEDRNDFVKSEHRNVLYIMSAREYTPHSTLVA